MSTLTKNYMARLTHKAMKLLTQFNECLSVSEQERFGRDLDTFWDKLITGDEEREFKVNEDDIISIARVGNYKFK